MLRGIIFRYGIGFNGTSQRRYYKRRVSEFIFDETLLKVGENHVWPWVAIEPIDMMIVLGIRISFERTMLVAERFIQKFATEYGKHHVRTDGGTWYPQACKFKIRPSSAFLF